MWRLQILLLIVVPTIASAVSLDDIEPDTDRRYHVRLLSGDVLIGTVVDIEDDGYDGGTLRLRTAIGIASIYASQIAEIVPLDAVYPHSHRIAFMPTAIPIGRDLYAGVYQMLMPTLGVGVGDVWSFSGGRTVVPGLAAHEQASLLMLKTTVYNGEGQSFMDGSFAVGLNLAWLNAENDLIHVYGAGTWKPGGATVTALVFAKIHGEDEMTLKAGNYGSVMMRYATGTVGAGVGFDMPVAEWRYDLRLIGELWTSDLVQPGRTAGFLGLRLWNTDVAADFGIAVLPLPAVAPVLNFVWTPRIRS